MHLHTPRITALSDAALSPEQREALKPASYPGTPPLNIFRTLARAPDALKAFLAWGMYILRNNALIAFGHYLPSLVILAPSTLTRSWISCSESSTSRFGLVNSD